MKISKQVILIVIALSLTSWFTAGNAQRPPLVDSGAVNEISRNFIQLNDEDFRISPTVKVILQNEKIGTIDMVKPNDWVKVRVITINKRTLVDTIWVLPPQ